MSALGNPVILGLDHEVVRVEILPFNDKRLDAIAQIVVGLPQVGDDALKNKCTAVLRSQHALDVLHHENSRFELLDDPEVFLIKEVALVFGEIRDAPHAGSPCQ